MKTIEDVRIIEYRRVNGSSYYNVQEKNCLGIWINWKDDYAGDYFKLITRYQDINNAREDINEKLGYQIAEKIIHRV